jgi:hypothetical protein
LRDFLSGFSRLAHLALQNINKYYVIFSHFRNFVAKSDQKPKTKNGVNETFVKEFQLIMVGSFPLILKIRRIFA